MAWLGLVLPSTPFNGSTPPRSPDASLHWLAGSVILKYCSVRAILLESALHCLCAHWSTIPSPQVAAFDSATILPYFPFKAPDRCHTIAASRSCYWRCITIWQLALPRLRPPPLLLHMRFWHGRTARSAATVGRPAALHLRRRRSHRRAAAVASRALALAAVPKRPSRRKH